MHSVLDRQPGGQGVRRLGGGVPQGVVRLKRAVPRPQGLEPVSQRQEVLPLVVRDADEIVEKGPGEVWRDGRVSAEAGDDVPTLFFFLKGEKKEI